MGPIAALGGVIAGALGRILAVESLKWIATRALVIGSMTLILPVVLYNVFTGIMEEILTIVTNEIQGGGVSSVMIQITGLAGWIGTQINIAGMLSIFLSAVALRFVLAMIRGG
jgi:hypothetical protein